MQQTEGVLQTRGNQIVVYQPNETMRLDVRIEDESVWLNRRQLAELFGCDVKTIGKHIANALEEELKGMRVVAKFATVQKEGGRTIVRRVAQGSLQKVLRLREYGRRRNRRNKGEGDLRHCA